jgi:hypothetical protein
MKFQKDGGKPKEKIVFKINDNINKNTKRRVIKLQIKYKIAL